MSTFKRLQTHTHVTVTVGSGSLQTWMVGMVHEMLVVWWGWSGRLGKVWGRLLEWLIGRPVIIAAMGSL